MSKTRKRPNRKVRTGAAKVAAEKRAAREKSQLKVVKEPVYPPEIVEALERFTSEPTLMLIRGLPGAGIRNLVQEMTVTGRDDVAVISVFKSFEIPAVDGALGPDYRFDPDQIPLAMIKAHGALASVIRRNQIALDDGELPEGVDERPSPINLVILFWINDDAALYRPLVETARLSGMRVLNRTAYVSDVRDIRVCTTSWFPMGFDWAVGAAERILLSTPELVDKYQEERAAPTTPQPETPAETPAESSEEADTKSEI